MTILVDFDGVIHDINNPLPGKKMGPPIAGAKDAFMAWMSKGYKVHVFTVRGATPEGIKVVETWMRYYGIPFYTVTNVKMDADYFIDDKAITFDNWSNVMPKII